MTRIDTTDQLDALPIGSVIGIERRGYPWLCQTRSWVCTRDSGVIEPHEAGPLTLLFVPGRDLVQEAKAQAWDEGSSEGNRNPYRDEAP